MSFEPPAGILDIGNATLRVGKLEVSETTGLNQGLQNIVKNDLLLTETAEYSSKKHWGLKLPTAWVGEFEVKGQTGKYVEFNFYNEGSTSNAQGYTLNFKDTSLTLKYDNEPEAGLATATIPTIVGTFRKVNIFFERGVIAVFIDSARVLYFKESDTYNSVHGHPGVASRVVSTTGGAFLNLFVEDNSDSELVAFKNLRIVNGRFISDKTSNVSFIGSLGVGVNNPKESLDIRGNMHLTRVSNVSQVKVDSNVVTEYTGPHKRVLTKYPKFPDSSIAVYNSATKVPGMSADSSTGAHGYVASASGFASNGDPYQAFDGDATTYFHSVYPTVAYTAAGVYGANNRTEKITDVDGTPHNGEWLKIQMPVAVEAEYMVFQLRENFPSRFPSKYSILGSNDDSNWYLLRTDDKADVLVPEGVGAFPRTLKIDLGSNCAAIACSGLAKNKRSYKYFVIVGKEISHLSASGPTNLQDTTWQVTNWEIWGCEDGDVSIDTKLKSTCNKPPTVGAQLEVYYPADDYTSASDFSGTGAVLDKSGNTTPKNGTQNGNVGFDPTYKAFTFAGSNNIVRTLTNHVGMWKHSIAFWVKVNNFNARILSIMGPAASPPDDSQTGDKTPHMIISQGNGTGDQPIGAGTFRYDFFGNDISAQTPIKINTWYHIVATYDGGNHSPEGQLVDSSGLPRRGTRIYINGKRDACFLNGNINELNMDANSVLYLGGDEPSRNPPTLGFNGSIADFRIYNRVISEYEIQELFDYKKGLFFGTSDISIYKGHLGVGVTEPSGQIELSGSEELLQYPPNDMTTDDTHFPGHGVFSAAASSYDKTTSAAGERPFMAFRRFNTNATTPGWNSDNIQYYSGGSGTIRTYAGHRRLGPIKGSPTGLTNLGAGRSIKGEWISLRFPYSVKVTEIMMRAHFNNGYRGMRDGYVLGRKRGEWEWEHVYTITNLGRGKETIGNDSTSYGGFGADSAADSKYARIRFGNHDYYDEYAIIVTATCGWTRLNFQELRFYGTPGKTTLNEGKLDIGRSLNVPEISKRAYAGVPAVDNIVCDWDTSIGYREGYGALNGNGFLAETHECMLLDVSGNGYHLKGIGSNLYYDPTERAIGQQDEVGGCRLELTNDVIIARSGAAGQTHSQMNSKFNGWGTGEWVHSVAWWIKYDENNGTIPTGSMFALNGSVGNNTMLHFAVTGDTPRWDGYGNAVDWGPIFNDDQLFGKWIHMAVTYRGGNFTTDNVKLYLNGEQVKGNSTGTDETLALHSSPELQIFNDIVGKFGGMKIWHNYVLSPMEVKQLYNMGRFRESIVLSDVALGIGRAPRAHLDVHGMVDVSGFVRQRGLPLVWVSSSIAANQTTDAFLVGSTNSGTGLLPYWDYIQVNQGSCWNHYTGEFKCPVEGVYRTFFQANGSSFNVRLALNGGFGTEAFTDTLSHNTTTCAMRMMYCRAGDVLRIQVNRMVTLGGTQHKHVVFEFLG